MKGPFLSAPVFWKAEEVSKWRVFFRSQKVGRQGTEGITVWWPLLKTWLRTWMVKKVPEDRLKWKEVGIFYLEFTDKDSIHLSIHPSTQPFSHPIHPSISHACTQYLTIFKGRNVWQCQGQRVSIRLRECCCSSPDLAAFVLYQCSVHTGQTQSAHWTLNRIQLTDVAILITVADTSRNLMLKICRIKEVVV